MLKLVAVDDEPSITFIINRLCNNFKIPCETFNETKSLINHLQECEIKPTHYLIDMRLQLTNDLEGPEMLYNYLKENNLLTNFLFMTGNLSDYDLEVIRRTGADYILKPFRIKELLQIIGYELIK